MKRCGVVEMYGLGSNLDELVLSNVNLISNNFSTIKYVVWVKIWKYRKIKLLWSMTMIILMDDRLNEGY